MGRKKQQKRLSSESNKRQKALWSVFIISLLSLTFIFAGNQYSSYLIASQNAQFTEDQLFPGPTGQVSPEQSQTIPEQPQQTAESEQTIAGTDTPFPAAATDVPIPEYQGYLIEFEEDPILQKRAAMMGNVEEDSSSPNSSQSGITGNLIKIPPEGDLKSHEEILLKSHESFKSSIFDRQDEIGLKSYLGRSITRDLEGLGIREFRTAFNGIVLDIPEDVAMKMNSIAGVKRVYPNYVVKPVLFNSVPLIGANAGWKMGYTGKGVTIGIIDTGIDYTHPDLGGCFGPSCKVAGGWDFYNEDGDPKDDHAHGTHVAAIAAGKGDYNRNGKQDKGEFWGVAPDATLYSYKVISAYGWGTFADVIAGVELAVDPNKDGDYSDHLDIISLSLGAIGGNPDDPVSKAIDNAVNNGVVAVIGAGNSGPKANTITTPGTSRKAITVAAIDKSSRVAWFSSRGPVTWTVKGKKQTLMKPDIAAPGVDICAAQYDSAYNSKRCTDKSHVSLSGTSMATPHVSGAAALLLQKYPELSPDEVKNIILTSAAKIGGGLSAVGSGKVDINKMLSNKQPNPQFTISPPIPSFNQKITFDASKSSDPDGSIVSYSWKFGDGTSVTGKTVEKIFTSRKQYSATLTVVDNLGLPKSLTKEIQFAQPAKPNKPPKAYYQIEPLIVEYGDLARFDASLSKDPDGKIANYEWDFGDGFKESGPTKVRAFRMYVFPGTFKTKLTVTDNDGAKATVSQSLKVVFG